MLALTLGRDRRLYVGGAFQTIAGQARARLAAFDLPTHALASWNPGADGTVLALDTFTDGSGVTTVYAGGEFAQAGGQAASHLAAIGGASGAAVPGFAPGTTDDAVLALDVDATHVYAGGRFTSLGGSGLAYLAASGPRHRSRGCRLGAGTRRRGAGRGPGRRRRLRWRRVHDHRRRGARQPGGAVADHSGHRDDLGPERQSRGQRHRPRRAVRVRRRGVQRDRRDPPATPGDAAGRRQRAGARTCCRGGRAGTA